MLKEEMGEERKNTAVIVGTQTDESFWRLEEEGEQPMARKPVTIRPVISDIFSRLENQDEQLLPGLLDEIVLDQIVPKLHWKACPTLACVSRCWQQAIDSRQIYAARVRHHSTETLIVLDNFHSLLTSFAGIRSLCLYSVRERTWHQLPNFPHKRIRRGVPGGCGCVSLDGKIYVMGGEMEDDANIGSVTVYVLDLAAKPEWKQCANMLERRQDFACGVINGKIYVAGGTSYGKTIRKSEVYDPKENAWSSIAPMKSTRSDHLFLTHGGELYLYGGHFYDPDCELFRGDPASDRMYRRGNRSGNHEAYFAESYCPGKDEWKVVARFDFHPGFCPGQRTLFSASEELCSLSTDGISVHDGDCDDEDSWTEVHSFLFPVSDFYCPADLHSVVAVNHELLALMTWYPFRGAETCLLETKGFGSENESIRWEILNCPFSSDDFSTGLGSTNGLPLMCAIQL